ncbi:ABC-type polar amino acid transport system, ATPase component [Sphaerochaeta pleomorpha str. Grapes]|uniref:ABC-type polar amino acid transport system, ATPase component n=1 Tax=Sphaerochaeta pleomorpha (strain ATCC BAA-1885 / DSM 22778 / Grapes) TaxID=158190 RepID=G8QTR0_SPHPG|nr:amino acid ABC transporter ATP-binding protein [Sphaerochaeta pleomorpha]AEV28025.1 ABC-type polar amino acid transport system, ATPase component [Sphaerochaeta pleomorpha str. Grapes]
MRMELNSISKSFNGNLVLKDICFSQDISSVAIIGPSGGGKSTLLRILGGLLAPDSGTLGFDGKTVHFNEKDLIEYRKDISFVFQSKGLFEHLPALENVTLPLVHTLGLEKSEAKAAAQKLFDRFGLSDTEKKYPSQLSGGQQQRIAIARSLAMKPKLLLLDEPTSALDPEYTSEVLDMLTELQGEGLKTIIVTHEMGFAKNACETVVFLSGNRILEQGKSSEIFSHPQTKQLQSFLDKILEWNV